MTGGFSDDAWEWFEGEGPSDSSADAGARSSCEHVFSGGKDAEEVKAKAVGYLGSGFVVGPDTVS